MHIQPLSSLLRMQALKHLSLDGNSLAQVAPELGTSDNPYSLATPPPDFLTHAGTQAPRG
jgi:hypothetical protein